LSHQIGKPDIKHHRLEPWKHELRALVSCSAGQLRKVFRENAIAFYRLG